MQSTLVDYHHPPKFDKINFEENLKEIKQLIPQQPEEVKVQGDNQYDQLLNEIQQKFFQNKKDIQGVLCNIYTLEQDDNFDKNLQNFCEDLSKIYQGIINSLSTVDFKTISANQQRTMELFNSEIIFYQKICLHCMKNLPQNIIDGIKNIITSYQDFQSRTKTQTSQDQLKQTDNLQSKESQNKKKKQKKKFQKEDDDDNMEEMTKTIFKKEATIKTQNKFDDTKFKDTSLINFYKEKRIIFKQIYEEDFKELYESNQSMFIKDLTKNQIVILINSTEFQKFSDEDILKKYIKQNSHNYKKIEDVSNLAKGGESQIFRIQVTQPVELVLKIPIFQESNIDNFQAIYNSLKESHLIKLAANKDFIVEIMEEIIEFNLENSQIYNYVTIVECAINDLSKNLFYWLNPDKLGYRQEYFLEEKLIFICLNALLGIEMLHSKKIYFGDMKPENLLIFRNLAVKLGDFGVSVKLSDDFKFDDLIEVKGCTYEYCDPEIYNACLNNQQITIRQLLQNDYYCLFTTFNKIYNALANKFTDIPQFKQILDKLQLIKVEQNGLSLLISEIKETIQNSQNFIFKLCDQIIDEEKYLAIPKILKLSRFQNVFGLIEDYCLYQESIQLHYIQKNPFNQIEEDLIENNILQNFDNVTNTIQQYLLNQTMVEINPFVQRISKYQGALDQKFYYKLFQDCFKQQYYIKDDDFRNSYTALTPFGEGNVKSYFRQDREFYKIFSLYEISINQENIQSAQFDVLYNVFLQENDIEFQKQFLINFIKTYSFKSGEYYYQSIDRCIQKFDEIQSNDTITDQFKLFGNILKLNNLTITNKIKKNNTNLIKLKQLIKADKEYSNFKQQKSYFGIYYKALRRVVDNSNDQNIKYLKKERQCIKRVSGEQGDIMSENAFQIYQCYNNITAFDSNIDGIQKEKMYFLKKSSNYSHNKQKVQYLQYLAEEYKKQGKEVKCIEILKSFNQIDPMYEYILNEAFDKPYEMNQITIKEAINSLLISVNYDQIQLTPMILRGFSKIFQVSNDLLDIKNCNSFYEVYRMGFIIQEFNKYSSEKQLQNDISTEQSQIIYQKLEYPSGAVYWGNTLNWEQHGDGRLTLGDGIFIRGTFNQNSLQNGSISYNNGTRYQGHFKNGIREGEGNLLYQSQQIEQNRYQGTYVGGVEEGKGTYYFDDGSTYDGDFKGGHMEGEGTLRQKNGNYYKGEWKKSQKEGKGIEKDIYSEDIYEGYFKTNEKEGYGLYKFKDGRKYEGDWKKGQKDGKGTFYYKLGSKYEGDWKKDLKEGKGILTLNNGERYEGDYKNTNKEGTGIYYYTNGDRYEGQWKLDKMDGNGIHYYVDGRTEEQIWKEGKQIK